MRLPLIMLSITSMPYVQDNIIQWVFEKIFDQITADSKELLEIPFEKINHKLFNNDKIHLIIHKLTKRPLTKIEQYLSNAVFLEIFLFNKIKKKLYVQILLNNIEKFKYYVGMGHLIDNNCYRLMIINNREDMLKWTIQTYPNDNLSGELLFYAAEAGNDNIYFYLRGHGLVPNVTILNKAVTTGSLAIVKDINQSIGLSSNTLENAFRANHADIILFLLDEAPKENIHLNTDWINYSIMNNNLPLIEKMDDKKMVKWHEELYYSALLSGSMEMIKYLEKKMPNIHLNRLLDSAKNKKGQKTLLIDDIIYDVHGKKYFSHTMNYSIQSKSLEIVKYINSLGYGISASNFVTAINQGTPEIVQYLCGLYKIPLPFYYQHYFSTYNYVVDKIAKAKILMESGLIQFGLFDSSTIEDYKKESMHINFINNNKYITEDNLFDLDYLMKYHLFFVPREGYKLNYRLLVQIKFYLEFDWMDKLIAIMKTTTNGTDFQFIIDSIFLFGTLDQIKQMYPFLKKKVPSEQIIMEVMCYCQLPKLCCLLHNGAFDQELISYLYPIAIMLNDPCINFFFDKFDKPVPRLQYVVQSGDIDIIIKWLKDHISYTIPEYIWPNILMLDNIDILKTIHIPKNMLYHLIRLAEELDLMEVRSYLITKKRA